jgi:hypothetical protein
MATEKQLAALKKARAARAKKAKPKLGVNRSTAKKVGAKIPNKKYLVEVKLIGGKIGYLTRVNMLDTEKSKAGKFSMSEATNRATSFFNANKKHLAHVAVIDLKK